MGHVKDRLGATFPRDHKLGLEELTLGSSHPFPPILPHPNCVTSDQRRKELEVEELRLGICPAGVKVGRPSG